MPSILTAYLHVNQLFLLQTQALEINNSPPPWQVGGAVACRSISPGVPGVVR
jgi:hypothetical protein